MSSQFSFSQKLIVIEKQVPGLTERSLVLFTTRAQKEVGLKGKVTVLISSNRKIQQLNHQFRGKNQPTDVLSFPSAEIVSEETAGDIAISAQIAAENARRFKTTISEELKILILHGLLHLANYDHETDNGEMAREEATLRKRLGLSVGLIGRVQAQSLKSKVISKSPVKVKAKPRATKVPR